METFIEKIDQNNVELKQYHVETLLYKTILDERQQEEYNSQIYLLDDQEINKFKY